MSAELAFFLGTITGIFIMSVISLLVAIIFRTTDNYAEEKYPALTRLSQFEGTAEIFPPTSSEIDAIETVIKSNEEKGRDTRIEEIS